MLSILLKRLLGTFGVLVVACSLTFFIMHAVPGSPWSEEKAKIPEKVKEALRRKYGLDEPLPKQFIRYLWNAFHLDFGYSYQASNYTVRQFLGKVWPVSFHLGGMAFLFALTVGISLGVLSAVYQNTWIDYLSTLLSVFAIAVPNFVLSIFLSLLFGVSLGWLPPSGWEGPKFWILPSLALGLGPMGAIARYTRTSVIEALRGDYVRTARAKGLAERRVILVHALKNALIPVVTMVGQIVPHLFTGTIMVEAVFRVPGMGKWFVHSILERDYPVILGLSLLSTAVTNITYNSVDIAYRLVDPRVKLE